LFALAIPLYVLYEVSVFVAMFAYRTRLKRQAKRDAEEALSDGAGATA
jgi:Sec-independent protein secretion pathway component TatC